MLILQGRGTPWYATLNLCLTITLHCQMIQEVSFKCEYAATLYEISEEWRCKALKASFK
mgnify:CR=1 FL=1